MSVGVYDYITEQPQIMKSMLHQSKEMTKPFVELFKKNQFSRIIMVGSGSSYNAAQSAKHFMKKLLRTEIEIHYAHAFAAYEEVINTNSLLIGISQSGESTAAVESIMKAKSLGMANMAVTSEDGSYMTEQADYKMVVPTGEEKAGATTKGYTTTVLGLYLAAMEAAFALNLLTEMEYNSLHLKLKRVADSLEQVIERADAWYEKHRENLLSAQSIMVSGYGWNFGTALEAGLKFLETSLIPVCVYEAEEFMHGPYNAINENSFIFFISPSDQGKQRIKRLNEYVKQKTPFSYMVINGEEGSTDENDLPLPAMEDPELTPLAFIVPFQVLFTRLAADKGFDQSKPVYPDFHSFMNSKRKIDF